MLVGLKTLNKIGNFVKGLNIGKHIFIITDRKVGRLYLKQVIKSFRSAGFADIGSIQIRGGESSKTQDTYKDIIEKIYKYDKHQDKRIIVVSLGGGVIGDLGGYVALTYKRGVNYIQIPTTLLGQVDSGLGGKVGVNLNRAKNVIGGFWQPKLVYMDLAVLRTLDKRELKSGLAEVIKYGVIKNSDLFKYVEKHSVQILRGDLACLKHIVTICVNIKARITGMDERDEKDVRIILNFGHTIGHAIEAASNYRIYKHGEALSLGMLCAGEIACRLGMFNNGSFSRLDTLIGKVGLPKKIKGCSLKGIMNSMRNDKKFINGVNRFVLPTMIGKVKVVSGIAESLIKDVIKKRFGSINEINPHGIGQIAKRKRDCDPALAGAEFLG